MDKDGEKTARCESALPEAKRLVSSHRIDARDGEERVLMDFQHTNHRRNKDVFSKSKNSSINCIAFHFHCTILKPADGKQATVAM